MLHGVAGAARAHCIPGVEHLHRVVQPARPHTPKGLWRPHNPITCCISADSSSHLPGGTSFSLWASSPGSKLYRLKTETPISLPMGTGGEKLGNGWGKWERVEKMGMGGEKLPIFRWERKEEICSSGVCVLQKPRWQNKQQALFGASHVNETRAQPNTRTVRANRAPTSCQRSQLSPAMKHIQIPSGRGWTGSEEGSYSRLVDGCITQL